MGRIGIKPVMRQPLKGAPVMKRPMPRDPIPGLGAARFNLRTPRADAMSRLQKRIGRKG